jgi:hypothetical protein
VRVVDLDVGGVGAEVEQPEEEDPHPCEPERHALSHVGLELGHMISTLPTVMVDA